MSRTNYPSDLTDSNGRFSSSNLRKGVAGVERSEPPVRRIPGGWPTKALLRCPSPPATLVPQIANLELLKLFFRRS